ncbi:MAG TPA: 6-phosphogluconolactonase [Fodinibius sp.]|nr:6-phosphogluconolactonase [Fodinibius sp.]
MTVQTYPDPVKLSEAAALLFKRKATEAVKKRGRFTVALSGGSSPQRLSELLASDRFRSEIPWKDVIIFWGDERFVPPDDPQSNARMARECLLDHVPVPSDQIHPIPTGGSPETAAKQYGDSLASVWNQSPLPRFDFVLLGLGENGHTASLFPETEVLNEQKKWVAPVFLEEQQQYRITLTAPLLNNARCVMFLVFGHSKAQVLHNVLEGPSQPSKLPAQLIDPAAGKLYWLLDEAAASGLVHHN